jgi:hypothetical protein
MSALIALVLAQVVSPGQPAAAPAPTAWPQSATWRDGSKDRTVHLDQSLVAERDGTERSASELRANGAMVSRSQGRMRLWRVAHAPSMLAANATLLPVYRDQGSNKLRVPIGDVLVVPTKGVAAEKVRQAIGAGSIDANGVIRVPCPARDVFSTMESLTHLSGVWWVQPDWWLGAGAK